MEATKTNEIGLSIIPVSSTKQPCKSWSQYQKEECPISEWHNHYKTGGYVGIICGKISGNLELIDIDEKNDPNHTITNEYLSLIPQELLDKLIIQTTINSGLHLIYRCTGVRIEKNQKLAMHADGTVIIETRGEGGYFCTHQTSYQIKQGLFDLNKVLFDIPVLSEQEREFLLETARSLTRFFPKTDKINSDGFFYNEPTINEFNKTYDIIELFEQNEWEVVKEDEEKVYLLRKGSSAAHSGYYFKDSNLFYCFSTSTGFVPEKPYNHFQVLRTLENLTDYRSAIRRLPDLGYNVTNKKEKVSVEDISGYLNGVGVRYDSFIQDLTMNGNIIDEIEYNTLFINLKKHFDKEIPRTRFEEIIKSRYIRTINPIQQFIDNNKHRQPEGTFEKWLDCISLENKNVEAVSVLHFLKKWYVGMISQAMDGEFPNEFFLTLLSNDQGIGKTTFLRRFILPKELQGYIVEHSLTFDDDFKVIMGQSLLIIDDEMDGRTYESSQTFKSILSNKEMTSRRKYDRRISTIKRRCSFAGSGNNLSVIREQQNRRIIPIEIKYLDYKKLSQIDYSDLFMEAYNLYKNGFHYSYQKSDKEILENLYADYVQKSDVELLIEEYIQKPESEDDEYFVSTLSIVTTYSTHYSQFSKRINVVSIGKFLNERGLRTIRRGKQKTSGYNISKKSKLIELINEQVITL